MKINLRLGYVQTCMQDTKVAQNSLNASVRAFNATEFASAPSDVLFTHDVGNQNHSFTNHSPVGGSYQKSSAPATFGYWRQSSCTPCTFSVAIDPGRSPSHPIPNVTSRWCLMRMPWPG